MGERAGQMADKFLKSQNVQIHYNSNFEELNRDNKYDMVVPCFGYQFRTEYLQDNFPKCISPTGQMYVNTLL